MPIFTGFENSFNSKSIYGYSFDIFIFNDVKKMISVENRAACTLSLYD